VTKLPFSCSIFAAVGILLLPNRLALVCFVTKTKMAGLEIEPSANLTMKKDENGPLNGRWTKEEHTLFLKGLNDYGREWKKVATLIHTRSAAQVPALAFLLFSHTNSADS
jgi:hypothetical protein